MSLKKSMKARSRGAMRGVAVASNGRADIGRGSSAASFQTSMGGPRARRVRTGRSDVERDLEAQLRDVVAQLGLDSARRIFASLEAAFDV